MLRGLIAQHTPDQLSLPALLWTRALATRLIEQGTGRHLSVRNTALTPARWGFATPRPLAKARLRSATAAARWLTDDYPAVRARARSEGADIGWVDESRLHGSAPDTDCSVFSTVDSRGRMRWSTIAGPFDATVIDRLRRLHEADRKIVLIVDPLRVHRSAPVWRWLGEHGDEIELVHLPGQRDPVVPAQSRPTESIDGPAGSAPAVQVPTYRSRGAFRPFSADRPVPPAPLMPHDPPCPAGLPPGLQDSSGT